MVVAKSENTVCGFFCPRESNENECSIIDLIRKASNIIQCVVTALKSGHRVRERFSFAVICQKNVARDFTYHIVQVVVLTCCRQGE